MMSTYEPHAIIVVYSIIDKASFQTAEETLGYLWRFGYTKKRSLVLVANKVDLERSRSISSEGKFCFHLLRNRSSCVLKSNERESKYQVLPTRALSLSD